jgi:predicted SprT family Zn-dependent metalloprotease
VHIEECDPRVVDLVQRYLVTLDLPSDMLAITTSRTVFSRWLQRQVPFRIGGAYSMHPRTKAHRVFVHLERLDLSKPYALEVVVAEELIHMRDHIRGDFRRHSHHGFDRIALEVERVTGFTPAQQRGIFLPRTRRQFRYLYECPRCRTLVPRRRRGTWSCGRCSRRYRKDLVLRPIDLASAPREALDYMNELNARLLAEE